MSHFTITPKTDCPHINQQAGYTLSIEEFFGILDLSSHEIQGHCEQCLSDVENWVCLGCCQIYCSRFVHGHMAEHAEQSGPGHTVAFSLTDASTWCYQCDSYITNFKLALLSSYFSQIKFPDDQQQHQQHNNDDDDDESDGVVVETALPSSSSSFPSFTRDDLVQGLSQKTFQRVAILTGAGISVAAGIPDFRTPGTGLYAQVARLGLPFPEAIFSLDFFLANPQPFYTIAETFLTYQTYPVQAHYFIKKIEDEGMLLYNYTQNIDGLELEAGLSLEKVIQAHGHMRTIRCVQCKKEQDRQQFDQAITKQEVLYCSSCHGLVKPDIVFFGESLPEIFHEKFDEIQEADLVIVMGTSLKVYPFAFLLTTLSEDVPIVLINRENPGIARENFLFLAGEIEETVSKLAEDLHWTLGSGEKKKVDG
eukprot:gene10915-12132_t